MNTSGANWGGNGLASVQNLAYDASNQEISLTPYGNTIQLDLSGSGNLLVDGSFNLFASGFGTQISAFGDSVFQRKSTGDLQLAQQPLFRLFYVAIPPGGGNARITDPAGNNYPISQWICIACGFRNDDGDRAYQMYVYPDGGTSSWWVNYTFAESSNGYVQILAIPACFSSCYSV
jgi:hypothetical protein